MPDKVARDDVVRDLERARARTTHLTDLDDPILLAQHDPLMSPLVWDLAHVGQQEELWLLREGDPTKPGMLPPDVDSLYDAFKHRRADRPQLPLLPPVEARAYDHEVRGRVLDLLEKTPEDDLFTAGMVVQHEEQHDETMFATLQLRQGPPVLLPRRDLPAGRRVSPERVLRARRRVHPRRRRPGRAVLPGQRAPRAHRARRALLHRHRPGQQRRVAPVHGRRRLRPAGPLVSQGLGPPDRRQARPAPVLDRQRHPPPFRNRRRRAAGRARAAHLLLRGRGLRPLGRRPAAHRGRVGEGLRLGPRRPGPAGAGPGATSRSPRTAPTSAASACAPPRSAPSRPAPPPTAPSS